MKIRILLFAFTFLLLAYACGDDASNFCLSNQQAVQTGFYSSYYTSDVDSSVSNVVIKGIGQENDSILYDTATVSSMFLPLSMFHDITQFVVEINNLKDTLSFIHNKELSFVSGECGFIFRFELDTVFFTDNSLFIDSVAIDYPSIIYGENIENVKIYLY